MSADDEWWAVEHDPIEDALADCRNGHHGSGSVVLAEYVDQLRARVAELEAQLAELRRTGCYPAPSMASSVHVGGGSIGPAVRATRDITDLTASADHG